MISHSLGFPRIGANRELKFSQEAFWKGEISSDELFLQGKKLRKKNWQHQEKLNYITVGDFSFYDQVLDTSFLLGNIPERVVGLTGSSLDNYFRVARGQSAKDSGGHCVHAAEMTKWFDTNYHYIVPEVTAKTRFSLNPQNLFAQILEAKNENSRIKPVIIGPLTYLWLSKPKDNSDKLELLPQLVSVYFELLNQLAEQGIDWVQIDEPILVTELDSDWQQAFITCYQDLKSSKIKIMLATYFGELQDNLKLACQLPIAGLHIDAINAKQEVLKIVSWLPKSKILSLGVVDGRNIWKSNLNALLDWLQPIHAELAERLWIAPSCSLLHVPVDLSNEQQLDPEIKNWLAFAVQKLDEIHILQQALTHGRSMVEKILKDNAKAILSRKQSTRVHNPEVKQAVSELTAAHAQRQNEYSVRAKVQQARFNFPAFPTTTIGSFPQTAHIRQTRAAFKRGNIDVNHYTQQMRDEIKTTVLQQELLGLDVFVHGEPERNDMVEYFGEQLDGYTFTQSGWVQSYGSRCVKPPILFGDISRPKSMTVQWSEFAQSLTNKPMKGMLTGPVTILNWSFVRDDQPRSESCKQIALAIRQEVLDLEKAGIAIIQIDEAALREGLPLRRNDWHHYLAWAVEAFRICANGVKDETQIHTHMCYSEFNDILPAIASMDADVITIENSRSDMELLSAFDAFQYPNQIGPGVFDIHSPNIPSSEQVVALIKAVSTKIPAQRLWINPDCGLKTRQWEEVIPALKNMVSAALQLRKEITINI